MSQILFYFPGQRVTIVLEVKNANGLRVDSITLPYISEIISPAFAAIDGYHTNMTKINTGLYYGQFVLPTGASAVGSYLVDVTYTNPITSLSTIQFYQVQVNAPFGNFSTTVG